MLSGLDPSWGGMRFWFLRVGEEEGKKTNMRRGGLFCLCCAAAGCGAGGSCCHLVSDGERGVKGILGFVSKREREREKGRGDILVLHIPIVCMCTCRHVAWFHTLRMDS